MGHCKKWVELVLQGFILGPQLHPGLRFLFGSKRPHPQGRETWPASLGKTRLLFLPQSPFHPPSSASNLPTHLGSSYTGLCTIPTGATCLLNSVPLPASFQCLACPSLCSRLLFMLPDPTSELPLRCLPSPLDHAESCFHCPLFVSRLATVSVLLVNPYFARF